VDFGERLIGAPPKLVPHFVERHRVGARVAGLQPRKCAEETAGDADVRGLEADVEVVERARPVPLLALAIREPADGEKIARLEKPPAILDIETNTRVDFLVDVIEAGGAKTSGVHVVIA